MKHKRLERLAMFAQVAEQNSFAKAAEVLGVSKGHLSEQVKKLEREYGVPLMVRTTRNIRLTTEGLSAMVNESRWHHKDHSTRHVHRDLFNQNNLRI